MVSRFWPNPGAGDAVDEFQYEQLVAAHAGDGFSIANLSSSIWPAYADGSGLKLKFRAYWRALVRGYMWDSGDVDFSRDVDAPDTNPRVDLAVLRLDRDGDDITLTEEIKHGTPASSNPVAPALTQDPDIDINGGGRWEIPVVEFDVRVGATAINASDVRRRHWFLGRPPLVCWSTSRPPSVLGQPITEIDTGNHLYGTGSGWSTGYEDTGDIAVPAISGYWTASNAFVRRRSGVVFLEGTYVRKVGGGQVPANTATYMAQLPDPKFYPSKDRTLVAYMSGGYVGRGRVAARDGRIWIDFHYNIIKEGDSVGFEMAAWPVG